MIRFKDFEAEMVSPGLLRPKIKDLDSVLTALNDWIKARDVEVINVETVLLPNLYKGGTPSTRNTYARAPVFNTSWSQFVRLWYRST